MSLELTFQERGHRTWTIVRLFYSALVEFRKQYDSYEEKVLHISRTSGIQREVLRLRARELAELLDFKRLEALRDSSIADLKELCHEVFRTRDRTDLLDRYVSDIFHEISILKEEHYTVKTYAPMYEEDSASVELQYILDEAHTLFPQKLRHILFLFGKAQTRMEQLLCDFRGAPIFVRSLYLNRDGFVREAYCDGLRAFYRFMYPLGPLEGYYEVGLGFYQSGFFRDALQSFRLAESEGPGALAQVLQREHRRGGAAPSGGPSAKPGRQHVRDLLDSIRAKIQRLTRGGEPRVDGARIVAPGHAIGIDRPAEEDLPRSEAGSSSAEGSSR